MKIRRVRHHGKVRWRVNDAHGFNGRRQRRFFTTQEAARQYVRERTADSRDYGVHFASLHPAQRAAVGYQLQRLQQAGWTLPAAVDFVLKHGKAPPSISLGRVAAEFLDSRQASGCRPRYLATLRASIRRFLLGRDTIPIAEVNAAMITEYITANNWKPATMRSYLIDLRSLFSFAVKREYLQKNPGSAVDMPHFDDTAPGIVTPSEAGALLAACVDFAPDILPVVALCLFGGLRRAEAESLEWSEIGAEFVEVKAHKAKTRSRRLVPLTPQLHAWLDVARTAGCPLPSLNYADKFKLALERASLRANWRQNALRHSFASYHFAKNHSAVDTAFVMGNSPDMIFQHYRELVRPAEADAYFALMPAPDAAARATAARTASIDAARESRRHAAVARHAARRAARVAAVPQPSEAGEPASEDDRRRSDQATAALERAHDGAWKGDTKPEDVAAILAAPKRAKRRRGSGPSNNPAA